MDTLNLMNGLSVGSVHGYIMDTWSIKKAH